MCIYYLVNSINRGDNENAKANALSFAENMGNNEDKKITPIEIDSEKPNIIDDISSQEGGSNIIIAAGAHHIKSLVYIKQQIPAITTIWCGHQILSESYDDLNRIDHIVVPDHAITSEIEKKFNINKLVKTIGVAHTKTTELITKSYHEKKTKISNEFSKFAFVILSGDAPDIDQILRFFSKEEAKALALYFVRELNEKNIDGIIVTNGPRTGKHNPVTGEIINTHKTTDSMDEVSSEFINTINESGYAENIVFYDFKFDAEKWYDALLGLTYENENSTVYVPGESTSMISEALTLFNADRIRLYETNSMNSIHHRHLHNSIAAFALKHLKLGADEKVYSEKMSKLGLFDSEHEVPLQHTYKIQTAEQEKQPDLASHYSAASAAAEAILGRKYQSTSKCTIM